MTITPDEIMTLRELSKKSLAPLEMCVRLSDGQIMCCIAKDGEHGIGVGTRERIAKREAAKHLEKRVRHGT